MKSCPQLREIYENEIKKVIRYEKKLVKIAKILKITVYEYVMMVSHIPDFPKGFKNTGEIRELLDAFKENNRLNPLEVLRNKS